jgi:SAM-dependent methyltransferase
MRLPMTDQPTAGTPSRQLARRALLLPRLAALGARAPRNPEVAWRKFWGSVAATGPGGDVLWDAGIEDEFPGYAELAAEHFDRRLPLLDLGCGNGRFTAALTPFTTRAVGIDLAPEAVALARSEWLASTPAEIGTSQVPLVEFCALDLTHPESGFQLRERYGQSNVFVRGLLHILPLEKQRALAQTIGWILGRNGRAIISETDYRAGLLSYLEELGATATRLPPALHRAVATLPRPSHFGELELGHTFPSSQWTTLYHQRSPITVQTGLDGRTLRIPGFLAVIAATHS